MTGKRYYDITVINVIIPRKRSTVDLSLHVMSALSSDATPYSFIPAFPLALELRQLSYFLFTDAKLPKPEAHHFTSAHFSSNKHRELPSPATPGCPRRDTSSHFPDITVEEAIDEFNEATPVNGHGLGYLCASWSRTNTVMHQLDRGGSTRFTTARVSKRIWSADDTTQMLGNLNLQHSWGGYPHTRERDPSIDSIA